MNKVRQATITPLASIFGSGFLVIIPILDSIAGPYSVLAMALVCLIAFGVGSVIRYNIRYNEVPIEKGTATKSTMLLEKLSDIALVPAYIISVTLYLRILSSYLLGFFNNDIELYEQYITTGIILFILAIGLSKGLKALEGLEKWALAVTLFIIALVLACFAFYDIQTWQSGNLTLSKMPERSWWEIATILGGTLIVVQGFETSRYLGHKYTATERIQSSRNSQIISTGVYLLFVLLATPLTHFLTAKFSDNALIDLAKIAAFWLPIPLVLAAIFSQFSAAVADTFGASGNMQEFTHDKLSEKLSYLIICGFAILLCWLANTGQILALASRAFAFYYLIQCLVALTNCKSFAKQALFSLLAVILLFITVFAVPAG
ncbi:MAG: hypothetical protein HWE16_02130 [Gammaproteobacteria bacterium]|nr:hypothetical protein [Gammaproteobacteria bacterium]